MVGAAVAKDAPYLRIRVSITDGPTAILLKCKLLKSEAWPLQVGVGVLVII